MTTTTTTAATAEVGYGKQDGVYALAHARTHMNPAAEIHISQK